MSLVADVEAVNDEKELKQEFLEPTRKCNV